MQQARFGGEGPLPHLAEQPARREQPTQAQDGAYRQKHPDVIGLPDIDKDFPRIEQVIHGDRVEAGLEFVEEEGLDEQEEYLDEPEDEAGAQKPHPMPSAPKAPVRDRKSV